MRANPLSLAAAAALILLLGCAANLTRSLAVTPAPPPQATLPARLHGLRVAVAMDATHTRIRGGHHEGLLQVRQPWIFGLKPEQKALLYDHAGEVAALAFSAELKNQGLVVDPERADLALEGTVRTVTLDTYGHGTVEGYGSAGNYWEATVEFGPLRLTDARTGQVLWDGPESGYAKLSPCPARLDWTMLTLLTRSLKGAVALGKLQTAHNPAGIVQAGKDYVYAFEGSYTLDEVKATPIDVAARQAAVAMLGRVAWPGPVSPP